MQSREGELSFFLFGAVLTGNRVHTQSAFNDESLPYLHSVLKVLSEVAPSDHLQLTLGIIGSESIEGHVHLGNGCLIVLGVSQGGSLKDIHLEHAVVHSQL
jgi:hypothetical protein